MKIKKTIIYSILFLFFNVTSYSQMSTLLNFAGPTNGSQAPGSLLSDGVFLYGMTEFGGANDMGTIFKILPNGTGYVKLLDFNGTINGAAPFGSLIFDGTFLYGMTEFGGLNNQGTIFKILPDGSGYVKLMDFTLGYGGRKPEGSLFFDGTFLYGMTWLGGANDMGTVFKILPNGTGFSVLLDFNGTLNGRSPIGSLISDGTNLYGMTTSGGINDAGTIFKIMPNGTGYVKMLDFAPGINGNYPEGSLFSDGTYLYGMTRLGGINDMGTIFKILLNGNSYTKIYDFGCGTNGIYPYGTTFISDGIFLYGMTELGGTNNKGTIFKIKPNGTSYEKLFDFTGAINGSNPYGSLISDGNFLYGMTTTGGSNNLGTIFKYDIPSTNNLINFCEGETIQLNAPTGINYFWNGPNSFSSTAQNPTIVSSSQNASGTYSVIITDSYGCTSTASTDVVVNQLPSATISAPSYLCEMNPNSISINSSSTFQSIYWSTNPNGPNYSFSGQGTNSITPSTVWPTNIDLTISVNATDLNGCQYINEIDLFSCCSPNVSGNEFFERIYTNQGANNMSNQLPNGFYNGPTQQIIINLPTPQSLLNSISTPYSSTTTISQFILNNPSIYNSGTSTISTPNWIFFNNDVIIDQIITFEDCDFIRLAPGAKIIIQPGINLGITRSTLAPKCSEMWGGIEMNDNTQSVNLNNSSIIGAEKGLLSSNGGYYQITGSRFIDNLIGIQVQNYSSVPTLSTVVNSYFGDIVGQPLLPPFQTEPQPMVGIVVNDINYILIGSSNLVSGNLFHNHQRGIQSFRSSVQSNKNNFHNIRHAVPYPIISEGDKFAAIYATNGVAIPGGISNHTLTVGGSITLRNNFLNCEFGVSSKKSMNLNARFNYMKNCALRGISAEDNPFKTIAIYNNDINSTNSNAWGIYVKNYSFGNATISLNQINTNSFSLLGFTHFAAGIYVSSVNSTVYQTTKITYNTIQNCLYGIWMINMTDGLIESNTVNINFTNNLINSLSNNFAPIRGIVVQNSTKAKIRGNTINRNLGTGNGVINSNLQGIRLEFSPASEVWNNRMYNTAVGFYAFGSSLGSRIECNQMHSTRNGFYLDFADLSDQGSAPVAMFPNGYDAHNQWFNTFGQRTDGAMTFINDYYHGSSPNLFSNPSTALLANWYDNTLVSPNPYTSCVQALSPPIGETPIAKRTRELLPIVENSILYDTLDYQQKHFLNLSGYSRLENDSNLLLMNVPEDSIYINYLLENSIQNSQSKIIYDSQKAIAMNDFSTAIVACNQISTSCNQYNTNKIVQELWIDRKMNNQEFTSSDTLFLMDIACLNPIEFGSGVYQARAMIDWDGFCFSQNKSTDHFENNVDSVSFISKIYPNPSQGRIQIESKLPVQNAVILDMKGSELCKFVINGNYNLDTKLSSGVYLLKIVYDSGEIEIHKIYVN